jgi:hypothetical protein
MKIVTNYENFFSNHDFFQNIFQVCALVNRKEPESQCIILAPAPGGNLISGSTTLAMYVYQLTGDGRGLGVGGYRYMDSL